MKGVRLWLLAGSLVGATSCARPLPDDTPEGAFDLYLRAMEETPFDPHASARAFALLAPRAQEAIRAEAARAQQLTGKPAPAESMFTPTWTPLRFPVDRTRALVLADGVHAIVDAFGVDPQTQHVRVPMVREWEAWRLELEIPPPTATSAPAAAP